MASSVTTTSTTTTLPTTITTTNLYTTTNEIPLDSENVMVAAGIGGGTIAWALFNCILLVFILGGNLMTIIAVRTCRRLRGVISNLFILSLAVSDFMVGLALPFHFAFYLGSHLGESHCFCLLRFFLVIFACCVSTFTLITIAIDRYIAIIYALHYRRFMTRRLACTLITLNWTVGALVAAIPMFWNHWHTANECEFDKILPSWYMVGFLTPGFILIWSIMLLVYWRIMREASKQARQLRNCTLHSPTQRRHFYSDWKSIQIVVLIMGCFSICWLPYFIVACIQIFGAYKTTSILYKSAFSLAMMNAGLNPIIYAWKNTNFRKAFSLLLRCKSPNMHLMHLDGSFCSQYLPRQQSNMSIAFVAPPASLATKSDMDIDGCLTNNGSSSNNNNNNNNDTNNNNNNENNNNVNNSDNNENNNNKLSSAESTTAVAGVDYGDIDVLAKPTDYTALEIVSATSGLDNQLHSTTNTNTNTNTTTTTTVYALYCTTTIKRRECAACYVSRNILLKSMQFRNLFTQRSMTNKMLM